MLLEFILNRGSGKKCTHIDFWLQREVINKIHLKPGKWLKLIRLCHPNIVYKNTLYMRWALSSFYAPESFDTATTNSNQRIQLKLMNRFIWTNEQRITWTWILKTVNRTDTFMTFYMRGKKAIKFIWLDEKLECRLNDMTEFQGDFNQNQLKTIDN